MIRSVFFLLILTLSGACGSMRSKCIPVVVNLTHIEMVQINPANSMYVFLIQDGSLKGSRFFVNRLGEPENLTNITLSNPDNPMECLPVSPEKWTWSETLDETGAEITMQGSAILACGKKNYCIDFSYSGPLMKSPGTTVPGN